jgi:DNA-directed RNA polymerase specialized sigma24 family protein
MSQDTVKIDDSAESRNGDSSIAESIVLSEREWAVWIHREHNDLSRQQTADELGISKNTVDELYQRAKSKRVKAENTVSCMRPTESNRVDRVD